MIEHLRASEAIAILERAGKKHLRLLQLEPHPSETSSDNAPTGEGCPRCHLRRYAIGISIVASVQAYEALRGTYDEELIARESNAAQPEPTAAGPPQAGPADSAMLRDPAERSPDD